MLPDFTKRLAPNLFYLDFDENSVLFSPLERKVATITRLEPNQLGEDNVIDALLGLSKKMGFLPNNGFVDDIEEEFMPTHAGLFITSNCNLRCIYCYGNAGFVKIDLPFEPIKNVIDYIVANAVLKKVPAVFSFHGGGEPATNWGTLVKSVEYMKHLENEYKMKIHRFISTNGFLPESRARWIANNIDDIQLSFDGKPDVQNIQRPAIHGRASYPIVGRTIRIWTNLKKDFMVRATLTSLNLDDLLGNLEFMYNLTGGKKIHVEPAQDCVGGRFDKLGNVRQEDFASEYISAKARYGDLLIHSVETGSFVKNRFCGASYKNFNITPEGNITTCYEVTLENDPRSKYFFIGDMENEKIKINKDRLRELQGDTVDKRTECQECFVLYNCGGDCPAKTLADDYTFSGHRCYANKALVLNSIKKLIGGK